MAQSKVTVHKINSVHMEIRTEDTGIYYELREFFQFRPEGYQFNPSYKNKIWDGYIRLFNPNTRVLYIGLIEQLQSFCAVREYELEIDPEILKSEKIPDDYAYKFAKFIKSPFKPFDSQNQYVTHCIREKRALVISPTSSGKSFIIHLIQQHYFKMNKFRCLIVVPTLGLIRQMINDFKSYGVPEEHMHDIHDGRETDHPIVIATWQTLAKLPEEWFEQFQVVIGDEAHTFAAKSLIRIMESLVNCEYRFGFTGTISSKSKVNKLVLEGLFGPLKQVIKTKDLMDDGTVAKLNIKCLILNYTKADKKDFRTNHTLDKDGNPLPGNKRYQAELSYIQEHEGRNKFIRNLIWSMKDQNNLILFERVEHGRTIKNLLEREDRILHFVHGDVSADVREQLRHDIENDPKKRHDVVASFGTFSTGISIKRLDNLFFVASSKSEIRVLQSIGRLLRKGNGSDDTTLYDLTDVLSNNKSKPNYMMKQFQERVEIYSKEKFNFKIFTIDM